MYDLADEVLLMKSTDAYPLKFGGGCLHWMVAVQMKKGVILHVDMQGES
jgi:hypothetical protein